MTKYLVSSKMAHFFSALVHVHLLLPRMRTQTDLRASTAGDAINQTLLNMDDNNQVSSQQLEVDTKLLTSSVHLQLT